SMDDAEDAVQETSIRVWQSWSTFRQDSSFKTWVYRIASNLCLDKLRQSKRRALPVDLFDPAVAIVEPRDTLPDSAWIWPSPDFGGNPEDRLVRRDTLQLCFIALLQTLPPRQRAVLILKDVFEWSSKQIAETLAMSPAAVNSALQRARETMDRAQLRSDELSSMDVQPEQELLSRYVEAFEQFDIAALVALFHEEGCMSMPPFEMWIHGKEDLSAFYSLTRWHCEVDGPQMAVQVHEAPMIHDPMIFRISVQFPAQGERGIHDLIDLFPALEGQRDRHLCILARIDGFLLRERIKKCLIDQHDLQIVADHDGYRILVLH
ncbi:hypothetical protein BGX30_000593, partial [Mortierella sp. GBA39]